MNTSATLFLPSLISGFNAETRRFLFFRIVKIGGLAITPAFLIKAVTFLLALALISRFVQRVLLKRVLQHLHVSDAARFALGRFSTYLLILVGLFIALQSLGVNLSSLVVFGGAIGIGVGLGLQNVVSNFVAGLILLVEQPIRRGDRIETEGAQGEVVRIAARATWIRTEDNLMRIVPNANFIQRAVTNWTADEPTVRVAVPVEVGYQSDPERVREVLLQAALGHAEVLSNPAPDVIFSDFGDNGLRFILHVWTLKRAHIGVILRSDLYFDLVRRFGEAGIDFPQPPLARRMRSPEVPPIADGEDAAEKQHSPQSGDIH